MSMSGREMSEAQDEAGDTGEETLDNGHGEDIIDGANECSEVKGEGSEELTKDEVGNNCFDSVEVLVDLLRSNGSVC